MFRSLLPLFFLVCASLATAQTNTLAVRLANLEQDVRLLSQTVGSLRLELESMSRENANLRTTLSREVAQSANQYVTLTQLNSRLNNLVKELENSLAANQRATLEQVGAQIDDLAAQTQKALLAMSKSVAASPQLSATTPRFNDNFPKSGISYTVKSGDSLGKIARENTSRVEWIQNANKIAGELIYPGQQLFIPQQD